MLIGDEILSGKTLDKNGHHLANQCSKLGLNLRRITTVPDEQDDIQSTVRELSSRYTYVFTSGGVGPTHDDITYDAIGRAFGQLCRYHQATLDRMQYYFDQQKKPMTDARKRMALIPSDAKVFFTGRAPTDEMAQRELLDPSILSTSFQVTSSSTMPAPSPTVWTPVVVLGNVHILPGPPTLFQHLLGAFLEQDLLKRHDGLRPLVKHVWGTEMAEGDLADWLRKVSAEYEGRVRIGSYPRWPVGESSSLRVVLTFEGPTQTEVDQCVTRVKQQIPLIEVPSP